VQTSSQQGLGVALSFGLLLAGCAAKSPPPAETATFVSRGGSASSEDAGTDAAAEAPLPEEDAGAALPPATTPEEVAARWLEALRRTDATLLGAWTRYPFFLHDTGAEGTCGHGAAADAAQLAQLLSCLAHNEPLIGELRANPDAAGRVVKSKDLPAWARPWRNEPRGEATLVLIEIPGHGNSSHFVLVVSDGGVQALWKQTIFDTK